MTRYFPLRMHIATLVTLLVLLVGGSIAIFQYRQNSRILLQGTSSLINQFAQRANLTLDRTIGPIYASMEMLAGSPSVTQGDTPQTLQMLAKALQVNPELTRIGVRYPSGERVHLSPVRISTTPGYLLLTTGPGQQPRAVMLSQQLAEIKALDSAHYPLQELGWISTDSAPGTRSFSPPQHGEQGLEVSAALNCPQQACEVIASMTLNKLSSLLQAIALPEDALILMLSESQHILAYHSTYPPLVALESSQVYLRQPEQLKLDIAAVAFQTPFLDDGDHPFRFAGENWYAFARSFVRYNGERSTLLMLAPTRILYGEAWHIAQKTSGIVIGILLCSLLVVWLIARRISKPLQQLSASAGHIARFDFGQPLPKDSLISEIHDLSESMGLMKSTICQFLDLLNGLASESNLASFQNKICKETRQIADADISALYLFDDQEQLVAANISAENSTGSPEQSPIAEQHPLRQLNRLKGPQLLNLTPQQVEQMHELHSLHGTMPPSGLSMILLPLNDRNLQQRGLLCLLFAKRSALALDSPRLAFVKAFSGFASLALESRELLAMQKALQEAIIQLIASAIDAKSPYTSGHCQRVPELTKMLTRAACVSQEEPFADFTMDDDQWEALHIAAWMHDCGKVTTPEYVVDKATRLETLNNRIHEIRTRFEVLKRDAELYYWRRRASGQHDMAWDNELSETLEQLDQEFAFVAACNDGEKKLDDDDRERLQQIASRTWLRTLDDTLGLSWEEAGRHGPAKPLPCEERLLADKPEHRIPHVASATATAVSPVDKDNPWGFKVSPPELLYNRGELHNLQATGGTLTDEERFKINEHIIQTIMMLETLPYPPHLKQVPELAGGHHEKMDGTGYPRRLRKEQMSLQARIMAIADIFEALTAADRPYKKPKTLSQAIAIMAGMSRGQHIDADLFRLFLQSGCYLEYARRFLAPAQCDAVDVSQYLQD